MDKDLRNAQEDAARDKAYRNKTEYFNNCIDDCRKIIREMQEQMLLIDAKLKLFKYSSKNYEKDWWVKWDK